MLAGLALNLGRHYALECAGSAAEGLEILRRHRDTVVIISDMRMPVINGAQFLAASREIVPDARCILLTGCSDISSAIAAVNEGQICRLLIKPCAATELHDAIELAIREHDRDMASRSALLHSVARLAARFDRRPV